MSCLSPMSSGTQACFSAHADKKTGLRTCSFFRETCISVRASLSSWEGGRSCLQQDALHLQSPENLLATFLMVMRFTSSQDVSGVTLKKIRTEAVALKLCPVTAPAPTIFDLRTIARQISKGDPRNSCPARSESLLDRSYGHLAVKTTLTDSALWNYSTKMTSARRIIFGTVETASEAVPQ